MGLDPLMQVKFFELLHTENKRGMTIFFSSHILSEVQMLCKRVAIIREGKIVQIENIETLRKKQLKKIHIEFGESIKNTDLDIRGIENIIVRTDNMINFIYSGNVNELISALAGKRITNLTIEEPSLEEIFMHYYK